MHVHTQEEQHTRFSAKTIWMPSSGSGGKEDEDTGERTKRKTTMNFYRMCCCRAATRPTLPMMSSGIS